MTAILFILLALAFPLVGAYFERRVKRRLSENKKVMGWHVAPRPVSPERCTKPRVVSVPFVPESGRAAIVRRVRRRVLKRAGYRCEHCGTNGSKSNPLHIDHLEPHSWSADDDPSNLQVLCRKCNCSKGNRYAG